MGYERIYPQITWEARVWGHTVGTLEVRISWESTKMTIWDDRYGIGKDPECTEVYMH